MGEAKRRKKLDSNFGKAVSISEKSDIYSKPQKSWKDILKTIAIERDEEQRSYVKDISVSKLLSSEQWLYKTADEKSAHGKLVLLLATLNLSDRLDECLEKGYIDFNESFDDDGELICRESVEYCPNADTSMCEAHWGEESSWD